MAAITNSFLKAYDEQCQTLANTLVIKSGVSADRLNDWLVLKYGSGAVDQTDPTTWKYYLNISGEYHSTDTLMTVTSLDTQEQISFTKANLEIHSSTKKAYEYGSRYYYALVNQYKDQEQLILGILYPVNITTAIAAKEGTILGYPAGLVEPQEQTLIADLQAHIQRHLHRYNTPAFGLTDTLYDAAYHGIMYSTLRPKILNLRSARCHTPEVHSFHVREYLASHKYLNKYLPYMTLSQQLHFYRNINFYMRHAGTSENFELLLKNILTVRRIPMSEYSVRHLNTFDEQFYPNIQARRKPINDEFNTAEISYIPTPELFTKEKDLVYGNTAYYDGNSEKTLKQFQNSASSVIQTKDLESNMVDYSDAWPDPLPRVLMRQWTYMANNGLYDVTIRFRDPKTGDTRSLYALDALIYYQYISLRSVGYNVESIPHYMNFKARARKLPTVDELLAVVPAEKRALLKPIAQSILSGQPAMIPVFSSSMFFDVSYKIYEQARAHWYLTSNTGDLEERGYIEQMILKLYHDEEVVFNTPHEYIGQFLSANNLPAYDFTYDQSLEILQAILTAATGLEVDDSKLLKNIQKNLVEMMMELSSYTIQTICEINETAVQLLNWPAVRPGNAFAEIEHTQWFDANNRVNGLDVEVENIIPIDSNISGVNNFGYGVAEQVVEVTITSATTMAMDQDVTIEVPFVSFRMDASYEGYDANVSAHAGYLGKEMFDALSDEQKKSLLLNQI